VAQDQEGAQHSEQHEAVVDVEVEGDVFTDGQEIPRHGAWDFGVAWLYLRSSASQAFVRYSMEDLTFACRL
jgi:hypothetical protein